MNKSIIENGLADMEAALAVIPLDRAGVCVNCERIFTILPGQATCPKCMSQQWRPVGLWVNPFMAGGAA